MLIEKTVNDFICEVSSSTPAPGGGSISALSAAMSAGLFEMAVRVSKKVITDEQYNSYVEKLDSLKKQCTDLIDEDSSAFNIVMKAYALPKTTDAEKKIRSEKIQEAMKKAAEVPLKTADCCIRIMKLVVNITQMCKDSCFSDAAVGYYMAESGFKGAVANIAINMSSIKDEEYKKQIREKLSKHFSWYESNSAGIHQVLDKRLGLSALAF